MPEKQLCLEKNYLEVIDSLENFIIIFLDET